MAGIGQRSANVVGHTDQVHVAVNTGVFLIPTNQPQATPEGDMQRTFTVSCPTGGYWVVRGSDGGVYGYGAQGQTSGPGVAGLAERRPRSSCLSVDVYSWWRQTSRTPAPSFTAPREVPCREHPSRRQHPSRSRLPIRNRYEAASR